MYYYYSILNTGYLIIISSVGSQHPLRISVSLIWSQLRRAVTKDVEDDVTT